MTLGDRIAVMRDGVLQQYGPPLDVYHRPANRFVAGFVGTPPMNFLTGRLIHEAGGFHVDVGFGRVPLAGAPEAPLDRDLPREVVIGIRPEDAHLSAPPGAGPDEGLPMRTRVIEILGADKDVYLETPRGGAFVARVSSEVDAKESSDVKVYVDSRRVYLFGPGEKRMSVGLNGHGVHDGAR